MPHALVPLASPSIAALQLFSRTTSPPSEEEDVYNDPDLVLPFPDKEEATQTLAHDFSATLSIPCAPTPPSPTPVNW